MHQLHAFSPWLLFSIFSPNILVCCGRSWVNLLRSVDDLQTSDQPSPWSERFFGVSWSGTEEEQLSLSLLLHVICPLYFIGGLAMRMLAKLPEEQHSQVSRASLVWALPRKPTHEWVVDGHCHLELLRQQMSVNTTVENTVQFFIPEHYSSII